jgi:RNA-directed DNA polymerase
MLRIFLESDVMIEGRREENEMGSPQGGVTSPLIASIYPDAFDQEMKCRGHRIVRYADDILILIRSQKAAENACQVATEILEKVLRLKVNTQKTHLVHASQGVNFLGVEIGKSRTLIQDKKLEAFKMKVKALSRRNSLVNVEKIICDLNPAMGGVRITFGWPTAKGSIWCCRLGYGDDFEPSNLR